MNTPLNDIWHRVLEGDAEAWSELVNRYATLVYSVARRNGLDEPDAADCAQQTWMALYTSRNKVKEADKIPGWLAGTAYRRAMRIVRSQGVAQRAESQAGMSEPPIDPEEQLGTLRRQAILKQAIGMLDDDCSDLLGAMFFAPEELSYRQIARQLGMSFNSLGPRRKRCLEKLKKILESIGAI